MRSNASEEEAAPRKASKTAELAARLQQNMGITEVGRREENKAPPPAKVPQNEPTPGKQVEQINWDAKTPDEALYVNLQMLQDDSSVKPVAQEQQEASVAPRSKTDWPPKEADAPPPLPAGRPPMGGLPDASKRDDSETSSVKARLNQLQNKGETTPSPAPLKRDGSFRSARKAMDSGRPGSGQNSGYNSGTSGDGVVKHGSAQDVNGRGAIAPMGSSSESDYSGDGRVQRCVVI